jgi:hypothetical protein
VLQHAPEGGGAPEHLELVAVRVLDHDPADVGGRRAVGSGADSEDAGLRGRAHGAYRSRFLGPVGKSPI